MGAVAGPSRRYKDEELDVLLKRAAELHQAGEAQGAGLTLAELEEVAREAGIDVRALHRAAAELDDVRPRPFGGRAATVAGGPMTVRFERTLPIEAAADAVEALVPLIESASGMSGRVSLTSRTLSWRAGGAQRLIESGVLVSVRNGQTRILAEERYGALAATVFGAGVGGIGSGVGFGVGVGVGVALGSPLLAIGFPIAWLGASYLGSRALFGGIVRRRIARLETLLDTLSEDLGPGE